MRSRRSDARRSLVQSGGRSWAAGCPQGTEEQRGRGLCCPRSRGAADGGVSARGGQAEAVRDGAGRCPRAEEALMAAGMYSEAVGFTELRSFGRPTGRKQPPCHSWRPFFEK